MHDHAGGDAKGEFVERKKGDLLGRETEDTG